MSRDAQNVCAVTKGGTVPKVTQTKKHYSRTFLWEQNERKAMFLQRYFQVCTHFKVTLAFKISPYVVLEHIFRVIAGSTLRVTFQRGRRFPARSLVRKAPATRAIFCLRW